VPKQAFGSPGGKTRLAPKIIPMFPPHRIYVEPFAGGAAVYFRKGASEKEVLNDKDAEIAFAFRFLANMTPKQFQRLKRKNWIKSERRFRKLKALKPRDELERFYRFYYLKKASFGRGGRTFSHPDAGKVIGTDHLWRVHERLKRTRVHNKTALKIIDKYDSPDTLFYLDPPYPGRAFIGRNFSEYTGSDLEELIRKLKGIKGKFLLSLSTEHQKYLPPAWKVRRLKLRRNIPAGDKRWNQGRFQFEIVAGNYNLDKPPTVYRKTGKTKPVVSARGSHTAEMIELAGGAKNGMEVTMANIYSRRRSGRRKGRRSKGVYSHPSQVPGILFRDRALPKGFPTILASKLKKGAMTDYAVELGYVKKGQAVGDIPDGKMGDFARDLAGRVGQSAAMGMFNYQVTLRKNRRNGFKNKMVIAVNAIRRKNKTLKVRRQRCGRG
jgi:DNA adenine methylase